MTWHYEKLDENLKIKHAPVHDADGKITGKHIINLKEWFDENPEERKRLGWIKHISLTSKEIKEQYPHNRMTHFIMRTTKTIDEYTVEDEYHIAEKSEEMLWFEEMYASTEFSDDIVFTVGDWEEV